MLLHLAPERDGTDLQCVGGLAPIAALCWRGSVRRNQDAKRSCSCCYIFFTIYFDSYRLRQPACGFAAGTAKAAAEHRA